MYLCVYLSFQIYVFVSVYICMRLHMYLRRYENVWHDSPDLIFCFHCMCVLCRRHELRYHWSLQGLLLQLTTATKVLWYGQCFRIEPMLSSEGLSAVAPLFIHGICI